MQSIFFSNFIASLIPAPRFFLFSHACHFSFVTLATFVTIILPLLPLPRSGPVATAADLIRK
jgi:hypothetical protein